MRVLGSSDDHTVVGYDPKKKRLSVVMVNLSQTRKLSLDLNGFRAVGSSAQVTVTNAAGAKQFVTTEIPLTGKRLELEAEPNSLYSVTIERVRY